MKRLIDFCLLLLMVFWGSNAWADKTMTFGATSPTSDCNLTKLRVEKENPNRLKMEALLCKSLQQAMTMPVGTLPMLMVLTMDTRLR